MGSAIKTPKNLQPSGSIALNLAKPHARKCFWQGGGLDKFPCAYDTTKFVDKWCDVKSEPHLTIRQLKMDDISTSYLRGSPGDYYSI